MMMTFSEQNMRCLNYGDVIPNIVATRLELTGEVKCSPIGGEQP
ncbi:MAG: hypothetical protein ACI9GW_000287 [Halieaceae bacterium]|jgi:hypothetical protein